MFFGVFVVVGVDDGGSFVGLVILFFFFIDLTYFFPQICGLDLGVVVE